MRVDGAAVDPWVEVCEHREMALHYIVPTLLTAQLLRVCPKCATRQLTKMREAGQDVVCKRCGTTIPVVKR
ncbi:MAG: hypothetical protein U0325_01580 [Polyangiales bacterium]